MSPVRRWWDFRDNGHRLPSEDAGKVHVSPVFPEYSNIDLLKSPSSLAIGCLFILPHFADIGLDYYFEWGFGLVVLEEGQVEKT
jgi:hypothetical protein